MRETTKKVTHMIEEKEYTFRVRKLNALDGSFMLKFVAEKLIPLIDSFQSIFVDHDDDEKNVEAVAEKRTDAVLNVIPKALASISKEELYDFQKQCLNNVDILLEAGYQKVMSGDDFGTEVVEYDPLLALLLCYDVVSFNFASFFGGKGLSSVLKLQNSFQRNA